MSIVATIALMTVLVFMLVALFSARLIYCTKNPSQPLSPSRDNATPFRTLIVLGSGGHTAEMLTTIRNLDFAVYRPLHFVAAKTDQHSLQRAYKSVEHHESRNNSIHLHSIYRSREVRQSWITTFFTTFYSLCESLKLVLIDIRPDIIICNGPGTCIPILCAGLVSRALWISPNVKLIFLESFCRVDDLSMSGKIAYRFVNLFIVQWPQLAVQYPLAKYIGRIF